MMYILDQFLAELQCQHFNLTIEGSLTEYLGIKFDHDKAAGTITMTQKGLIQKIIKATGLNNCHPNWTPALVLTQMVPQ